MNNIFTAEEIIFGNWDDDDQIVAEGVYPAECVDFKTKEVDGTNKIRLTWKITSGVYAGKEVPWTTRVSPSKVVFIVPKLFAKFGLTQEGSRAIFKKSDFLGKECLIVIAHATGKNDSKFAFVQDLRSFCGGQNLDDIPF